MAKLESQSDVIWAKEFVEVLLTVQNVEINPGIKKSIGEAIDRMLTVPVQRRTISTLHQYINHTDKEKANPLKAALHPYTIEGIYGQIFDNDNVKDDIHDWTMYELGPLMNLGEAALTPALMYLFHHLESVFEDLRPTLYLLDECWLYLKNKIMRDKMMEYLKTLRKYNVYCVFATQEVADAANSEIAATILQQCFTKIYLADSSAMENVEMYKAFGLSESEVFQLSNSTMKRDYYYKSPLGTRMFQLELGPLSLGLIGGANHDFLDKLEKSNEDDYLVKILNSKNISYEKYLN